MVKCSYCKRLTHPYTIIKKKIPRLSLTKQHVLPRRRGGSSDKENLKDCCYGCNQSLNAVDDCPGALACMRAIADHKGYKQGSSGVNRVIRELNKAYLKV